MSPVDIHRQQERENPEPAEAPNPIPWFVIVLTLVLLAFGIVYIARQDITGPPSWGDDRTVAELRGKPAAAATAAGAAVDGAVVFASHCAACHQATGQGLPGVFPPLAGSEWVAGKASTVAAIVLHGINGPLTVKGSHYAGAMPAFGSQLSDAEIAAVLSHVRSSWGNSAPPLDAATVAAARKDTAARTTPFSGDAELLPL